MTTVTYNKTIYSMEIEGHAGYSRTGSDIVCAACSALSIALMERAQQIEDYNAVLYSNAEKAIISVSCSPSNDRATLCREMLDTIAAGFKVISELYPGHIKINVKE